MNKVEDKQRTGIILPILPAVSSQEGRPFEGVYVTNGRKAILDMLNTGTVWS